MSYDPPTGPEKAVAILANRIYKRLDKSEPLGSPFMIGISVGHALEGVRCNGTERLTTVIDCIDSLEEHSKDMIEHVKAVAARKIEIDAALKKLKDELVKRGLKPCPKCRGPYDSWYDGCHTKGQKVKTGASSGPMYRWEDCDKCNGRGLIGV